MKIFKKIMGYLIAVLFVAGAGVIIAAYNVTLSMDEKTASGTKRNLATHVVMRDGVKIAVELWLPKDYDGAEPLPTLIRATRYGRAYNARLMYRVLVLFGQAGRTLNYGPDIDVLNAKGYAVVRIDARGSGASEGVRNVSWSHAEIADYGQVADWIIQQKWSNGRIGAYGVSYDGNTADLIAATKHPAIKAVAPLYSYFDPYQNLSHPGGVFDDWFVRQWSKAVHNMDYNSFCKGGGFKCWYRNLISDGIKPVDGDKDDSHRQAVYEKRNNPLVYDAVEKAEYRDDVHGITGKPFDVVVPFARKAEIEASFVAMNPWVGWFDAGTVNGALSRYLSFSNPQQLVIAPLTHGGKHDTDPYAEKGRSTVFTMREQYEMLAGFFDPLLKDGQDPATVERQIRYYTVGEGKWKTTQTWPPEGVQTEVLHLSGDGALSAAVVEGTDSYQVDRTTASVKTSRWHAIGGPDVFYGDQREEDKKRLTYTSAPFEKDVEITGVPVVHLYMMSSTSDCAVFAYLEDVAPGGKVTNLSEGMLRCQNRKISDQTPPYQHFGAYHSHARADIMPMRKDTTEYLNFPLYALSAQVKKGHSIRLAIAGHDATIFRGYPEGRYPEGTAPVFTIAKGLGASRLDLPVKR